MMDEPPSRDPITPTTISATAYALEALQATGQLAPEAQAEALHFLTRCRMLTDSEKRHGGFAFTNRLDSPLNKAGGRFDDAGRPGVQPYHSATCDGAMALQLCIAVNAQKELQTTIETLSQLPLSPRITRAISDDQPPSPLAGLHFYNAARFGRVWSATHDERLTQQRDEFLASLMTSQNANGSWSNPIGWMREDDPLIATALAISALHDMFHRQDSQGR